MALPPDPPGGPRAGDAPLRRPGGPARREPARGRGGLGYAGPMLDLAVPLLLLAGGEIVLGLLALRVLWWVARGWSEGLDGDGPPDPEGPGGGRPVFVLIEGQRGARRRDPTRLRPAA